MECCSVIHKAGDKQRDNMGLKKGSKMTDVHTAILEAHAWDGRTNDRGIDIIKFCEGWPKVGKPYVMSLPGTRRPATGH